jgi:sulfhydrogenase subunit delta
MSGNGKPKIAFFDFSSCEGCQLTVVDSLQTHPELLQVVDIVQFREAMSERGEDYLIAFIEGSCTRQSDEARLQKIRQQAGVVVALGACAHLGGVNALKSLHPLDEVRQYVYGDKAGQYDTYDARPISAVIPVDFAIPGCPIDRDEFVSCVTAVLLGKKPPIPDYPVCMGSVTRAGCKAICPSYGAPCEACRGHISLANDKSIYNVMAEHGLSPEQINSMATMFNAYQMQQAEKK